MFFRTIGDDHRHEHCVNICYPYLECKHYHSADAHPAVQRVQVREVEASVEVKHSTQAQDGQKQSQKHQSTMHQLPDVLLLHPGERYTIHNNRCRHIVEK